MLRVQERGTTHSLSLCLFAVLGIEPRACCILTSTPPTELHPQPVSLFFFPTFNYLVPVFLWRWGVGGLEMVRVGLQGMYRREGHHAGVDLLLVSMGIELRSSLLVVSTFSQCVVLFVLVNGHLG